MGKDEINGFEWGFFLKWGSYGYRGVLIRLGIGLDIDLRE